MRYAPLLPHRNRARKSAVGNEQWCISEYQQEENLATRTSITLKPQKTQYALEKLMEALAPEQLHGEIDFGASVGKEVIDR